MSYLLWHQAGLSEEMAWIYYINKVIHISKVIYHMARIGLCELQSTCCQLPTMATEMS